MLRRLTLLIALAGALLAGFAPPAMAHTDVEPREGTAGSVATLTFLVEYEGSGTTGVDVELPEGASVVEIPAKDGWTSSDDAAARTVSWRGGPVDADEEFEVVVQLPATAGVVLFPTIQLTTDGEAAWISPEEGGDGDSKPAPRMTLAADPNATTTTAPTTTEAPSTSTTVDIPGTTVEAANEGDGGSAAPWLIGAGIAAAVAIAIGGTILKRRVDRDASDVGGDAG